MQSGINSILNNAAKRFMPKMSVITDMYKKNLEYLSAMNKVMGDVVKNVYHLHTDLVKNVSDTTKDVYEKSKNSNGDLNKVKMNSEEAVDCCMSKYDEYTEKLNEIVKKSTDKIVNLTTKHSDYAASILKESPMGKVVDAIKTCTPGASSRKSRSTAK